MMVGVEPPAVRYSRASQCGRKQAWPSRAVAENMAVLLEWAGVTDEGELNAYPCPWCSDGRGQVFHLGHRPPVELSAAERAGAAVPPVEAPNGAESEFAGIAVTNSAETWN